ncbi:multiple inositol polyphosphate phosphatase 1-like isoform X2 [Amphiura filiformis]|uniref:multiple inositol polyphosphate phosphatase 1-like isoform X2 n=1 Tax=Amphiura filiformis TaxID=82378 RepID=UPI003B223450
MASEIYSLSMAFFAVVVVLTMQTASTNSEKMTAYKPKYSTKTGYDLAFDSNNILRRHLPWKELFNQTVSDLQTCTPAGIYAVYRHGSRYPNMKDIGNFSLLLKRVKENRVNPEYDVLQNGKEMPMELQTMLSNSGEKELKDLGLRLTNRFAELFPSGFQLSEFAFQSTHVSRVTNSTLSFIKGLINDDNISATVSSAQTGVQTESKLIVSRQLSISKESVNVTLYNKSADNLLRFFDVFEECLNQTNEEEKKFLEKSDEVGAMQHRLIEKLSVPGSKEKFNLSRDDAVNIAKLCGYELALFNYSHWCTLLSDEDLSVFEYKLDLKHYWNRSYGHPVNYCVGCNLVQDIINYFDQVTSNRIELLW